MPAAIVEALAAMVCYGVADFIYKRAAAAGIRADHFLMAQGWFFVPLVFVYAIATRMLVPDPAALWGSLAGLFAFIGLYYFFRSLAGGAVSTNASIFRLNFIVTAVLAIMLLGEPLTHAKLAGLGLALSATWLLLGAERTADPASSRASRRSLGAVMAATLAFGASNFFHTVGLRHGGVPETLAVAQAAIFMPLATLVVYRADRRLAPPPLTFVYGAIAAVVLLGATILLLHSVAHGQASVLVPIAQMGFIVAALLGIFVLGERVTLRKAAGLAAALAALTALAVS
jgi:drug/metabolite transporter (DMT)-like permease